MTRKWIAINLGLLLCAGLLGRQVYLSILRFDVENNPARIQPAKKPAMPDGGIAPSQAPRKYSEAEFSAVTAQNLFAESRKPEEQTETAPVVVETPALDYKPVLIGVIISGSQRMAMINDTSPSAQAGVRRTQSMRPGDTYRGYVVTDITPENMVLELGTRREVIPLFDASKHTAQSGRTPPQPIRIVSFGPSTGTAAGQSVTAVASAPGAPGSQRGGAPGTATPPLARPGLAPGQPAQGGGRGTTPQRTQPGQTQGQAPMGGTPQGGGLTWNQTIDSQGRVIINSPFGPIPVQTQTPPTPIKK
jgi:hypothetical protein